MVPCEITLSANAGIALALGHYRIWVDALHREKVPGFSALDSALFTRLQAHPAFQDPNLICVTHCHKDHYAPGMLRWACDRWPEAMVIHPDPAFSGGHLLQDSEETFSLEGLKLRFFQLPHAKDCLAATAHYGLLLTMEGKNILLAGDCEVASPALSDGLLGAPIHLAILNFLWLTLPRGRRFLEENLHPQQMVFYHLPFAQDDRWGYRKAAERELARLPEKSCVHILQDPLEQVRMDLL